MRFFFGQESLTVIEWALRAVIAYIILLLAAKILGQRAISQLRLLDFIIAIILGNILAHPLSDEELGMVGSITTTVVLVLMYYLSLKLTMKSMKFETFLTPPPIPIISNGKILYQNLGKAKISMDFLLSELRLEKIDDIKKIAVALWEPGGRISVFLDNPFQTLTPNDVQISKSPFTLPTVIIKDGKIDKIGIKYSNKSKEWLMNELKETYHTTMSDIILATIDNNNNLQIYYK